MHVKLRYVERRVDHSGAERWYWHRHGHKLARLPDNPIERMAVAERLNAAADSLAPDGAGSSSPTMTRPGGNMRSRLPRASHRSPRRSGPRIMQERQRLNTTRAGRRQCGDGRPPRLPAPPASSMAERAAERTLPGGRQ
jgi:hypothetical protein